MQTFLPYNEPAYCARVLDNKRLGKQRVEALQILDILVLKKESRWKNHPAVKMWEGHEAYLLHEYTFHILYEWEMVRHFKNDKCREHFMELVRALDCKGKSLREKPYWLNRTFCITHQSNLIRKKPEHYKRFFPNIPDNIPYIWPV